MAIFNRLFGFRWSLHIVTNGNELQWQVNGNSVLSILGHVMNYFHKYGDPKSPWSLHLNFNRTHASLPLLKEHFTADGTNLSPSLFRKLREIEPQFDRIPGAEPVVLDARSKKQIPISRHYLTENIDDISRYLDDMFRGATAGKSEVTLFSVLDQVFGVEDRRPP